MLRVILSHLARPARMPSRVGLLGLVLLAAGCAGTADIDRMSQFQAPYAQGDWWGAAATLGAGEEGVSEDEDNLLTLLQAGAALRAAGSFETSQTAFDRAESKLLWKADEIDDVGEFLEAGLSIVGNDLISSYHGNIYDGVLINTYKAMNALDQGDEGRARVELNRADQRQENAVHQLAAKVKALGEEDADEAADREAHASDVNKTYRDATKPDTELGKRIAAVRGLGKYRDLRNPFTDWLHGAFRLATGEANRASDLLRNAVVLDGERNRYVKDDFRVAEEAAAGTGGIPRRVWIVHEDGIGPRLDEFRYDLPVFAPSGFIYSGIALPEFVTGTPGVGSLFVEAGGASYRTEPLLDVDRYAATEFEAGYDAIVGKAIASAVVKVVAQIAAQQAAQQVDDPIFGLLLQVVPTALAAATTQADTRMWRALPKSINVASLPWPEDGRVQIAAGTGQQIADVVLPSAPFVLITVKTVSAGAPAAVHVAALGGGGTAAAASGDRVVRPAAALDRLADEPGIRLAVMTSEAAPALVRASGEGRAANDDNVIADNAPATKGHDTLTPNAEDVLTTSGGSPPAEPGETIVAHATAKHPSGSPDWWKHHVSVDRTLKKKGMRQLAFTQSVNAGGFARVVGEFYNRSSRKLSAMYRFTWLDAGGVPVDSILSGWQVVHALPGTHARFHGTAPRDDIMDFHLELSSVSRALGTGETNAHQQNTR